MNVKKACLFLVVVVMLIMLPGGSFAQSPKDEESFAEAMAGNNFRNMERILERRANRMDLSVCLGTIFLSDGRDVRPLSGFNYRINALGAVSLLLQYGADLNKPVTGYYYTNGRKVLRENLKNRLPVLSSAVSNYVSYEMIEFLLNNGANPNGRENGGETALFVAVSIGRLDLVTLLVDRGANVNSRANDGSTPLSMAYDRGEMEIHSFLLANGAVEFESKQPVQSSVTAHSAAPGARSSSPAQSAPATSTLQPGRYAASGSSLSMSINAGMVTLYDGLSAVGNGSYQISGSQLVVTFYQASGQMSRLSGTTQTYNIISGTSFSGGNSTWVYRGMM